MVYGLGNTNTQWTALVGGWNNQNIGFSTPLNANITIDGGVYNNSWTDIEIKETNFVITAPDDDDEESVIGILNRTMTIANTNFLNSNPI